MVAAVGNTVAIVVGKGSGEDLAEVDRSISVAVAAPLNEAA